MCLCEDALFDGSFVCLEMHRLCVFANLSSLVFFQNDGEGERGRMCMYVCVHVLVDRCVYVCMYTTLRLNVRH